ncbi:MAG: ribonucleoside triphosphate reductase [bacterium]
MTKLAKPIEKIRKRDNSLADFEQSKITNAIAKALAASGQESQEIAEKVSNKVVDFLQRRFKEDEIPEVEQVQDIIEEVLMLEELVETAKAYILYREQRRVLRETEVVTDEAVEIFEKYIGEMDWQVKENANMAYSLQGLNHYAVSVLTKRYWLNKIYPKYIREAYNSGDMHIHDLDCLATYCNGWDLYDLLLRGFGGVPGKVETSPAKHFRVALGQVVNFFYTLQGECFSKDTQVLTDSGWKYFFDVAKSDKIFTLNNQTNQIELQAPLKFYEFDYNGELYNFKTKKLDLMVTPNHNMVVDQYCPGCSFKQLSQFQEQGQEERAENSSIGVLSQVKKQVFAIDSLYYRKFIKAKDFNPNQHFIPKQSVWIGGEKEFFELPSIEIKQYRNFGKIYETIKIDSKKILINDWIAFFGFFLAEGNIYKRTRKRESGKSYHEYCVRIFQNQGQVSQDFEVILQKLPFNYRKKITDNKITFEITDKQLFSYLEQFGKAGNKFIPSDIKNLPKEQLKVLFDWMMKGDGHISNGLVEYSTKSQKLADDFQEVVLKLGWSANIYNRIKGEFTWFDVGVSMAKHFRFQQESVQKVSYQDKVYCLEVPNHTLYVRRNGKACWSGNSAGAQALSSIDTLLAPFIRYDNLDYPQVKQAMQEFLFNCAVPTRVGFQCLSQDTEILTTNGWKLCDQIEEGSLIKTFNVEKGGIEDKEVKSIFKKEYKGVMYNLKGERQDQLISPEHRVVMKNSDGSYFIQPIEEVLKLDYPISIPVLNELEEIGVENILPKDIKKVDYEGIIWCPNTENETVIAKRNGQVFITGNTPFSNVTLDIHASPSFAKQPVIIGGKPQKETYAEFQEEMNMFNNAFFEVMMQGDKNGRPFTFPIPTINITKDFPWDDPKLDLMWQATAKYGTSYFTNFIQSDMKPEDVRSMCCRLRIDNTQLYHRGGSLFGANPLTGSVGVVTINLPRLGYLTKTKKEFFEKLAKIMDIARDSLEMKRKALEDLMKKGLYPYSRVYLAGIEKMRGKYFGNHFSTIGLVGLNESLLNFMGEDIGSKNGRAFALEVLDFMRDRIIGYQKETGSLFNLEATPAEGTSHKLALKDQEKFSGIVQAGTIEAPFYTNSSQLPVNYTDDIFKALELQDELQCKYTGGTVQHLFLGEQITDIPNMKALIKKVFENFHLPYITLTPTFSICPTHGYIAGEHWTCPNCTIEQFCEVYSRVVGYIRPVMQWHKGKQQEFKERKTFAIPNVVEKIYENRGVAKVNID